VTLTYPKTRDEYRDAIVFDLGRLMQAVLVDDPTLCRAEFTARSLHQNVREYFCAERWKPTPVFEGVQARVPLGERLSIFVQYHDFDNQGQDRVQGVITRFGGPSTGSDGVVIHYVPARCRNERTINFTVRPGTRLCIYAGYVTGEDARTLKPLYEYEQPRPRPRLAPVQLLRWTPELERLLAGAV